MTAHPTLTDGTTVTVTRSPSAPSAPTIVFVHGFLDGAHVWDSVVDELGGSLATVSYDLPGSGDRTETPAPLTLEVLTADLLQLIDQLNGPLTLVAQSMGTQIAELVAAARPDRVTGLVLLAPIPLGGTGMPEEAVAPFKSMGGQIELQRSVRQQLSPKLTTDQLDRLDDLGSKPSPETVAAYVDIWNRGADDAPAISAYRGPVLVVRGAVDGFATQELVDGMVAPRFSNGRVAVLDGGGHWLHVEQPAEVAALVTEFVGSSVSGAAAAWQSAFAEKSADTFGSEFTEDVVLEASVLTMPLKGRHDVATALGAASGIYDALTFTSSKTVDDVTYLQWEAEALGGTKMYGVTILTKDAEGKIRHAAIHHRPLGAVLKFSTELRTRLDGTLDTSVFFDRDHDLAQQ
ncbi:alpha/beta hydrolase [Arthrobacter sp. NPDC080031]|uniref:alpha/beta fold hydrolase n=1 Tax=Arthrobacter sp. NPDC080031 TaxID=3155918 RepID=UPI00344E74DE